MKVDFRGAGGSSGGGSKFTTSPDNLRSNDTFEGLIGLCVGPIKGPVNGMQSIRVNQTPIEDTTGKDNFQNFAANLADGDPLKFPQIVTLRLGAAGAPDSINTQLRNIGGTNPQWSTHTLNQTGASHIDLRFVVNQLYRQDKNGIYTTTANILIQMKPVGTLTWINPFDANGNTVPAYDPEGYDYQSYADSGTIRRYVSPTVHTTASTHPSTLTITGKTTNTYVKELRVNVPNSGVYANVGWDVRCQLVENEDLQADPNFEKRNITWESATAVFANTLGEDEEWRAFSWLQLYGKASDSFSGVPEIDGVYDTKIVSVPPATVFNPDTRQYTGAIWAGDWAKAYTNDPAWIINDAITDPISGIARLVPGAYLNKWDALELSKYCSEPVSDGAGGTQPRFSLNLAIDQPQRSDDFIRYLAGACGATAWDEGDGQWRTSIDRPKNPVALYTYENIEGEFGYSHTDIDTRYNEVTVTFLNEEFDYRQDQLKVTDPDHIAMFGRKPTSVVAIGCTNRRQALRWAILKLRTNTKEWRNVTFTTNRQGKMLERFGWILIADQSLNQTMDDVKRTSGRVVQNNGTSIVLRDTVRLETGISYQINFTAPNPNYNPESTTAPSDPDWQAPTLTYTRNVTNNASQVGDVRELFIDSALPANVAPNANVALSCTGLPSIPKVYRVLDLKVADDGERVTVSAIEVDTGKYPASDEADYSYVEPGYAAPGADIPMPIAPSDGVLKLQSFSGDTTTTNYITVNWQRPSYPLLKGYRVERRWNGGAWVNLGFTTNLTTELLAPASGIHEFNIHTVDVHGRESLPLYDSIEVGELAQFAPTGLLTNESHTVAANADGTGFDLTGAGGTFELFSPIGTIVPADIVFSVSAHTNATATIDSNGVYAITGLTADNGTVTFSAVWGGYAPILKTYTISKSKAGTNGTPSKLLFVSSDRQTIYYDSSGNLTPATQTTTFKAQKQNTTAVVTWSVTDINGAAQTVGNCLSAATGDTVTMTAAQFAVACNGTNGCIVKGTVTDGATLTDQISVIKVGQGAAGSNGLHNAQVFLYQRGATAPTLPSAVTTYTFATGVLTGQNNGWTTAVPAATGQPLWVTAATASSAGTTDTITASEWATPVIMAQDGGAGTNGTNGINVATVFLYQRAASAPAVPSATTTYTFGTGVLSAINNGWSQVIPAANGNPCWFTTATALNSAGGTTDAIATGEWAAPVALADTTTSAPTDTNRVRFSLMEKGIAGYTIYDTTAGTSAIDKGTSTGKTYVHVSGSFTAANQAGSIGTLEAALAKGAYSIPVTGGERIFAGASVASGMPSSSCTTILRVYFYNDAGAGQGWVDIFNGPGSDPFWTRHGAFITVPANATYCSLVFYAENTTSGSTGAWNLYLAEPMVCSAGANQSTFPAFSPGPGSDFGADVTTTITGPAAITINADYTGAVTTAMPATQQYKLMGSATDYSASATWSVAVTSGSMTASMDATGNLSLNTSSGTLTSGSVTISATYNGSTRTFVVKVTKVNAPAPSGGSGGGTSASSSFSSVLTTTMSPVAPELDVTPGSGGQVALNADIELSATSGCVGTAQWYRYNGTSWVAVGTATSATYTKFAGDVEFGCSYTATGLSGAQRFQLWGKVSISTANGSVYGTDSATGS